MFDTSGWQCFFARFNWISMRMLECFPSLRHWWKTKESTPFVWMDLSKMHVRVVRIVHTADISHQSNYIVQ